MSAARSLVALTLVALAACGGGESSERAAPAAKAFTNPVWDENFPDPFVLRVGKTYYAYGTNNDEANVPTLRSNDLVTWRPGGDAMPELGLWAVEGKTWAPEVLRRTDGKYVLYYTASSLDLGAQCLGRGVSGKPDGPFVDDGKRPFVCQTREGGSIDASPFAAGGRRYLLWKNDGNAKGRDTFIYSQRLSADGLRLVGKAARLVKQDARWEGELVEAPTMWREGRRLYLFFSANRYYDGSYAVGYATCRAPLGPCEDAPDNPILRSRCDAVGPGHQSIVLDDDGETWLVYHAWPPDAVGSVFPGRVLWIDRLRWKDGKPVAEGPTCGAQARP